MKSYGLLSASALAVALVQPAVAQNVSGGIQEIVVTAQKRVENVQDVPIAISAFSADALQERSIGDVSQLSGLAPNVTLDAGAPFSGSSSVLAAYIRGIGANDYAFNIDPGVGIYVDGVYLARTIGANQDLLDVDRIEVLKGPQGTLFGRNSIGGALSIVTHTPGDVFRLKGDITTGSHKLIQFRLTTDVPITDSLKSTMTFSIKERSGYQKRIPFPGAENYYTDGYMAYGASGHRSSKTEGGDDVYNGRAKLLWDNGGPLRVTLAGDYSNSNQSAMANSLVGTRDFVFAGWYNACINNDMSSLIASGFGFIADVCAAPRTGLHGDLPPLLGVNVDGDPTNDRLPYDDRFITDDPDVSYADGNSFSSLRNYGGSGTIDIDIFDGLALKSITAYRELHWKVGMDLDGSPLEMLHTSFDVNQWQFSQEVQLLGNALDNSLNYVLGGYYFIEKGDMHDFVTFPAGLLQVDGPNEFKTKNYAFFGQIDWRPVDLVGITLGGRYTNERKTFEGFQSDINGLPYKQNGLAPTEANRIPLCELTTAQAEAGIPGAVPVCFPNPGEPVRYYIAGKQHKKFNNFSPKIGIQLHPTDDVMLYGSWSKGYKTGGWTTRLSNPLPYAPDFNEEKATTWEVGVKSTFLDRRLQLNAAAFTTNYKDIQLNFQQGVSPIVQNAGDARIRGFEVEAVAAPVRGLTINASAGYLDAYYLSVLGPAEVAPSPDQIGVFAGTRLPKTPEWKFNISPRYELTMADGGSVILLADYTHTTSLKNDTEGTILLNRGPVDLVNASITYRLPGGHWELTAGGTNLTNKRYMVTGQYQAAGGEVYGTYSRPAEWYARLGLNF